MTVPRGVIVSHLTPDTRKPSRPGAVDPRFDGFGLTRRYATFTARISKQSPCSLLVVHPARADRCCGFA